MLLKILIGAVLVIAVLAIAASAFVRLAPLDPEAWTFDPLGAPRDGDNSALVAPTEALQAGAGPVDIESPVYNASPEELMLAFDAMALAQKRTTRALGDPGEGQVTYVQRSALMGFPDYITVRALPAPGGATLAAFSRSRYGSSDMGVNLKRLSAWLEALKPLEQ